MRQKMSTVKLIRDGIATILILLLTLQPCLLFAQAESEDTKAGDHRLQKAIDLYYMGNFEEAIVILTLLVESEKLSRAEQVRAYQHLGASFILQNHLENARNEIIKALQLEPRLSLDPVEWRPEVVNFFNLVKSQVLGSLRIETEPDDVAISINNEYIGQSPLYLEDLVTDDYVVQFEKQGFKSHIDTVSVRPNIENSLARSLKKKPKFWLWGASIGAAIAVVVVLIAPGSKDEGTVQEPLGSPPPPP